MQCLSVQVGGTAGTRAEAEVQESCTCHEVQEGEALKVLGLLVAELHDLVVALPQSLYAQPMPGVFVINLLQHYQPHTCETCC